MRYITSVSSTLKGGCCEVKLGPRTVLCGPNGSGKSTIIQALELATRGWASDLEGRDRVKQGQALARLFPSGQARRASCRVSTGEEFSWSLQDGAKAGSYRTPEHEAPLQVGWPIQELQAVLAGDASGVQAWLGRHVSGAISPDDALGKLPPAVRATVSKLMAGKGGAIDLLALAKEAKGEARRLRSDATKKEKTINAMVEGIAPPLTDEARAALEVVSRDRAPASGRLVSRADRDREALRVQGLAVQALTFRAAIEQEPTEQLGDRLSMLRKAQGALDLMERHDALRHVTILPEDQLGYCWVCGSDGADWERHKEELHNAVGMLSEAAAYQHRCGVASTRCEALETEAAAAEEALATWQVEEDYEDAAEASERLRLDDVAQRTWGNAGAQRQEAAQLRAKADLLTSSGKALADVGRGLVERAKAGLEATVTAFLPEGDCFSIDLASARVGLLRDGELHSALAGGEWSRVLLALGSGLADGSTLNVLSPPDRGWDRDTLEAMMRSLSGSPAQIIVMSTTRPQPVEGWTLVDLTE